MKFRGRRNFIKSSSPNGESEDVENQDELQMAPPALQLKAENEGSQSNGEADAPFQLNEGQKSEQSAEGEQEKTTADSEGKSAEKEKFEVSKGFMQLGIEGFMDGGKHDVRRPHMPENLAVFKPASKEEKENKDLAKYSKDNNDRFVKKASGGYLRSTRKSIYNDSSYTAELPKDHLLGTYPNNSGLTIGYGYDMGSREKADVLARLKNAGFPEDDAKSLSEAAGLKGVKAAKMTSKLRNTGMMITKEQALKLLDLTIPEYENNIDMDKFHPAVVEVMVYLNYWRGAGGAKKYNKAIAEACEGKSESAQIKATKEVVALYSGGDKKNKNWTEQVFTRFGKILGELVEQQDAGKEIVVSENVKTKDEMLAKGDQTGELLKDSVGVDLDTHLAKQRLISTNVGYGAPNKKSDVDKVMARLVLNGTITPDEYASVLQSLDETIIGDYVKKFQLTYWAGADGIVEVAGGTETRLIAIKAPAKETPEQEPEDKEPEEGANEEKAGLNEIFEMYDNGDIDMVELAGMAKPFCSSKPQSTLNLFSRLSWYQRDNLACSLVVQSSDNELNEFDVTVLGKMSSELGGYFNTTKRAGNLKAQARVDAILDAKKTPEKSPVEEEKDKEEEKAEDQYTIFDGKAIIRESNGDPKTGSPIITKWTKVTLLETKEVMPTGKTKKINIGKVRYEQSGGNIENWTSMGNLYAQFWNPADHADQYENDGGEDYADVMKRVDPEASRAATIMSGSGVLNVVDQFFPNSTDVADLGTTFGTNLQSFMDFLEENGMTCSINAGLRHPLRSMVFDSAIRASKGSVDQLQRAQAQSIKYGLPIDWIHYKKDGTIDVAKSQSQADIVRGEFHIGTRAARGVKDEMGGSLSKHNLGNAVDMGISFGFKEKVVEKNGNKYTINAASESPVSTKKGAFLKNCGTKPLAKLGLKEFNVTRILDDDAIHWSPTGR